jgi:hypothetical protein
MAKRFTDSRKWDDEWFLALDQKYKFFWIYVLDKCDHVGMYKPALTLANFCIGFKYTEEEILKAFDGRIIKIACGKWFIQKFISFQYGKLSTASNMHSKILNELKNSLSDELFNSIDRVSTECRQGGNTPKDKVKDKEMEKEKKINNDSDKDNINNNVSDNDIGKKFEQFKEKYPKPVNDCMVYTFFKTEIKTDEDFENIMKALEGYKKDKSVKEGFIKNAENWLGEWRGWLKLSKKQKSEIEKYEVKK